MMLLLLLHSCANVQGVKNAAPCQFALQEHLAGGGTGLLQIHSPDSECTCSKYTRPIPISLADFFSIGSLLDVLVTMELPSAYSERRSLFVFFSQSALILFVIAFVPTFKHDRIDNQIRVLKPVLFLTKKDSLQMILLFPVIV